MKDQKTDEMRRWVVGFIFPFLMLLWAIRGLAFGIFIMDSPRTPENPDGIDVIHGPSAVYIWKAIIAASIAVHAYTFWDGIKRLNILRIAATAIAAVASAIYCWLLIMSF